MYSPWWSCCTIGAFDQDFTERMAGERAGHRLEEFNCHALISNGPAAGSALFGFSTARTSAWGMSFKELEAVRSP